MHAVRALKRLFDLLVISQRVHLLEKHFKVTFDFFGSLRAHVVRDLSRHLTRVSLKRLDDFLEVSSVPIEETFLEQVVLLNQVFFSKVDVLHAGEVAAILAIDFFLDQLLQPVWVREEPEVLDDLKFLALGLVADADVTALEDLWTKSALAQVALQLGLTFAALVLDDHVSDLFHDLVLLLGTALFGVVHILKLVKVHRVHGEIRQVELVLRSLVGFLENVHSAFLALTNQRVDVAVVKLIPHLEDAVCAVVDHINHLVFLKTLVLGSHTPLLDDQGVQFELHRLTFNHLLLHRVRRDESEDLYDLFLADAMGSVHGLQVHLRVPVRVKKDNDVGSHQVEPQAASSGRYQEDMLIRVRPNEVLDLLFSINQLRVAIQPTVVMATIVAVVLENVQHGREPGKHKNLVFVFPCTLDQLVKENHFA